MGNRFCFLSGHDYMGQAMSKVKRVVAEITEPKRKRRGTTWR